MSKLILMIIISQSLYASAAILQIAGQSKIISAESCRGLQSVYLFEDKNGSMGFRLNSWFTSSGGSTGHNQNEFFFSKLESGSFVKSGDELFYVLNEARYSVAFKDNSFFAVHKWKTHSQIQLEVVTRKLDVGQSCSITPVLTIY